MPGVLIIHLPTDSAEDPYLKIDLGMNLRGGKAFFLKHIERFVDHIAVAAEKSVGFRWDFQRLKIFRYPSPKVSSILPRDAVEN